MKSVTFKPLRRIKKTGKLTVASYMQWNKVKSADYSQFNLMVNDEYKSLPVNEYVYNHTGELLYWFNHQNPQLLPKNIVSVSDLPEHIQEDFAGEEWKFAEPIGKGFHWSVKGFDCNGVPVFSHYTQNYIASGFEDMSVFEPLTVGLVVKWLGWFLYQLENSRLQIGAW